MLGMYLRFNKTGRGQVWREVESMSKLSTVRAWALAGLWLQPESQRGLSPEWIVESKKV